MRLEPVPAAEVRLVLRRRNERAAAPAFLTKVKYSPDADFTVKFETMNPVPEIGAG